MPEAASTGGLVTAVGPDAARAGLAVGDVVLAVDGSPVRDVIDWLWLTSEPVFEVTVSRAGAAIEIVVERGSGGPLGVTFSDAVFDGVRECDNACAFCFVSQLPAGLRSALYVRDDDYRLSFLAGNFVTLTNVDDADIARIVEQHLSPLHVSIHAVDPAVRARLICPTAEDRALEVVDELLASGIECHVQIVLVPQVNDGEVLDETLAWLAARRGIASVGVVPMGYTEHQRRWHASFTPDEAAALLVQLDGWQARMRAARYCGWVYAADEFRLLAGAPIPAAGAYDDFPQYENGIGLVRGFLDEFSAPAAPVSSATLVTGELFAPVLRGALETGGLGHVSVLAVRNSLFGGNVAVAGLLGGNDIARAIAAEGGPGPYLVPDVVVNSDGLLLDDVRADRLSDLSGREVRIVGSDGAGLSAALTDTESQAGV